MPTTTRMIDELIQGGEWVAARKRIRGELKSDARNHWLLTQLGVTYYEQRRYQESLVPLWTSLGIVADDR